MVKGKGRIRTQISYSVYMANCRAERRAKLSNDLKRRVVLHSKDAV